MGKTSIKTAVIAALTTLYPTLAAPQQQGGATTTGLTGTATAAGTAATAGTATGTGATAAPGGLQVDLRVSTGLTFDDNFKLTVGGNAGQSTIWDTNLSLGISKATSVDTLIFRLGGVLRFADIPGRTVSGFESPDARLTYTRDGINSRLTLDARYRKADREFLDPFRVEQEEQLTGNLVSGGGTLTQQNYGLTYATGLRAPINFSVTLRHDERDYANTTSARLFDTRTDTIRSSVGFRVSPVTQLSMNLGRIHYKAEDSVLTDRKTTDYSIGLRQDINPVVVLNASLGYSEIKTDESLPFPSTRTRSGGTANVTLTQTLPNGAVYGTLASTLSVSGTRTTLRFGRDFQLPLGSLTVAAGATRGPNGSVDFVGTLGYTRQLQSSDISVQLDRSASTNSASEDVLNTRVSAGYGYQINNLSRLDLTLNYGISDNNTSGIRIERATLRGAYSRQMTADWNLVGGVQFRTYEETAVGNADSKQLFLTLDRNFSFRP